MCQLFHISNISCFFGLAVQVASLIRVRVFIWQPVVFAVLILKVGIALLTLLCSEVLKVLRTLFSIAELKLKIDTSTVFTSINWHWIVALARSEANSSSTGS